MTMIKKMHVFLLVLLVLVTFSQSVFADVIRRIEVEGAQRIEEKTIISYLSLKTGDALIHCTDWSKDLEKKGYGDNLRIEISTKEFSDFLRYEAY